MHFNGALKYRFVNGSVYYLRSKSCRIPCSFYSPFYNHLMTGRVLIRWCSIILIYFLVCKSQIVFGQIVTWDGGGDKLSWADAKNWDTDVLPQGFNDVIINPVGADLTVIINTATATCRDLILNGPGKDGEQKLLAVLKFANTGVLTVTRTIVMDGTGDRSAGIDMINGGRLICYNWNVANRNPETWEPGTGTVEITGSGSLPPITTNKAGGANTKFGRFNNLIIKGGAITMSQDLTLTGDLTISENGSLDALANKTYAVNSYGNWINNGIFYPRGATVTFSNTGSDQTISGINTTNFNTLILQKAGKNLNILSDITIGNQLTFSSGLINTSAVNRKLVTFDAASSYVGASTSAFISGPVQKIGTTDFIFPIGKDTLGSRIYAPLSIAGLGFASSTFTSEYFPFSALSWGMGRHPDIKYISNCEYWKLNRDAGDATPDVTLSWNSSNICAGPSYISQIANLQVACFNTTKTTPGTWDAYGGTATGTATTGSVTLKTLNNFVPLTLASLSSLSILPIRFAKLTATEQAAGVQIVFSNLTEEDVAKYYIERSADGDQFSVVGSLAPRLNNNQRADYSYLDAAALSGDSYYRIRGVETTGKAIYSDVVHLLVNAKGQGLSIYPNPAQVNSTVQLQLGVLPAGKYQLNLYNQQGQVVRNASFVHSGGRVNTPIGTTGLAPGRYLFELSGAQKRVRTLVLH